MSRLQFFKRKVVDQVERYLTATGTFTSMFYLLAPADLTHPDDPNHGIIAEALSDYEMLKHLGAEGVQQKLRGLAHRHRAQFCALAELTWLLEGMDENGTHQAFNLVSAPFNSLTGKLRDHLKELFKPYASIRLTRVLSITFEYAIPKTNGVTGSTQLVLLLNHTDRGYEIYDFAERGNEYSDLIESDYRTRRLVGLQLLEEVSGDAPNLPLIPSKRALDLCPGPYADEDSSL